MGKGSELHLVLGILAFLATLQVVTADIQAVQQEGGIPNVSDPQDTACGNITNESSSSEGLECAFSTVGGFLDVATLDSPYTLLNIIYILMGAVLVFVVVYRIIIPAIDLIPFT